MDFNSGHQDMDGAKKLSENNLDLPFSQVFSWCLSLRNHLTLWDIFTKRLTLPFDIIWNNWNCWNFNNLRRLLQQSKFTRDIHNGLQFDISLKIHLFLNKADSIKKGMRIHSHKRLLPKTGCKNLASGKKMITCGQRWCNRRAGHSGAGQGKPSQVECTTSSPPIAPGCPKMQNFLPL